MKRLRDAPLTVKFSIGSSLIVLVVVVIFSAYNFIDTRRRIDEQLDAEGANLSQILSTAFVKERDPATGKYCILFERPKEGDWTQERWEFYCQQARSSWNDEISKLVNKHRDVVCVRFVDFLDEVTRAKAYVPIGIGAPKKYTIYSERAEGGGTVSEGIWETASARGRVRNFSQPVFLPSGSKAGVLEVYMSLGELESATRRIILLGIAFGLAGIGVGIAASIFIGRILSRPIKQLVLDMQTAKSDISHRSVIDSQDEIGTLAKSFNEMVEGLENAQKTREEVVKIERELELAKAIQSTLVAKETPHIPGYDVAFIYIPARTVGGDYVDFFYTADQCITATVADVSGKGVPAALIVSMVKSLSKLIIPRLDSPARSLYEMNKSIRPDLRRGDFVSMQLARLNPSSGVVKVASAGHLPAIHLNADKIEKINPRGIALGVVDENKFAKVNQEAEFELKPGSVFVMYTDGVNEAVSDHGELYGFERLDETLSKHKTEAAADIMKNLIDDIRTFRGSAEQSDDITMIVIKRVS